MNQRVLDLEFPIVAFGVRGRVTRSEFLATGSRYPLEYLEPEYIYLRELLIDTSDCSGHHLSLDAANNSPQS